MRRMYIKVCELGRCVVRVNAKKVDGAVQSCAHMCPMTKPLGCVANLATVGDIAAMQVSSMAASRDRQVSLVRQKVRGV